jgi:hypothetical protein
MEWQTRKKGRVVTIASDFGGLKLWAKKWW